VQTQPAGPPRVIQSGIAVNWIDRACRQKRGALLTVFVSRDGMLPVTDPTVASTRATARVLRINVAYRVLTVQYADSRVQSFKVGRDVHLGQMQSGDDVIIQSPDSDVSACKP
jgi:hypothetical protein